MKTLSLLLAATVATLALNTTAHAIILPTAGGSETVKIANTANPTNFTSSGSYNVTFYPDAAPTMFNYTPASTPAAIGTVYVVQISGFDSTGASKAFALTWTNKTGAVSSFQNADLSAKAVVTAQGTKISFVTKDPHFTLMGQSPIQYLSFFHNGTYITDLTSDNYAGIIIGAILPGGSVGGLFILDGSTKVTQLPGNKAVLKNKIIGLRFN